MRKLVSGIFTVILAGFIAGIVACGVNEPDRYLRPPIIKSYVPRAPSLTSVVGDTLEFSVAAVDPDEQDLYYYFMLGDSVAGNGPDWTYIVHDTGAVDIEGRVSDGVAESGVRWHLMRVWPVNRPPIIVSVNPPDPEVTVIIGSPLEFSIGAIDPENKPLSYLYTVNGVPVANSRYYTFDPVSVGVDTVQATVTDGETFVSHAWVVKVAAEPDDVPPAKVSIVSLEPGAEAGEIDIEWVAVGDDGMEGLPTYYILRTSTIPIVDEHSWANSSDRPGEPAPASPGEIQRMVIKDLHPTQTVYVAVRAVDDFGNVSEISDVRFSRSRGMWISGTVRDAVTNEPIEGVRVSLLSSSDTTAADGTFSLVELPAGGGDIALRDEAIAFEYGDYFDIYMEDYVVVHKDVVDFWMLPNIQLDTDEYANFLEFYYLMTSSAGSHGPLLGRWDPPCHLHVPPLVKNNLDYERTIKDVFDEWEALIGVDIFEFVESVPDTGVYVEYTDEDVGREHFLVIRVDERGLPIQGRIRLRTMWSDTTMATFQVVLRHEVGHALRMYHSIDDIHIMIEGRFPAVTHPSDDEIKLGKAMYHIPRGFNASWFLYD